ncbi:MAG: V-type ATP synthase subunit F [Pseudomonadota bacterium]|nr:V-type ATP synthase subunit F [Pseudomonadota bacterium]
MAAQSTPDGTRMVFLGDETLADGFRMIGFETHTAPSDEEVERFFHRLIVQKETAFVVVDERVMQSQSASLRQTRREGGRIIVAAIPLLQDPPRLASDVADRLQAMFGNAR